MTLNQCVECTSGPSQANTHTGAKHESFKDALKILNINGSITVNPTVIQEHIISTTTTKLKHPEGPPKTGLYMPEDAPRNYPWGASQPAPIGGNTIDPFELETEATQLPARQWLHSSIQDEFAFAECIRNLKSGKAPGPDGVLNDIIKAAPPDLLATLHYFVQIMWATGCTPTSWKSSTLILLQKPNKDPLSFGKGYRKIGLENSLYKVWTSMVNQSMASFAEKHNILSNEQGGFRAHRSTQEQLELFTMLLATCAGGIPCFGGARYALWVFRMAQAASETAPAPAVMSYGMCYQGKCASQGISVVGICLVYCCSW